MSPMPPGRPCGTPKVEKAHTVLPSGPVTRAHGAISHHHARAGHDPRSTREGCPRDSRHRQRGGRVLVDGQRRDRRGRAHRRSPPSHARPTARRVRHNLRVRGVLPAHRRRVRGLRVLPKGVHPLRGQGGSGQGALPRPTAPQPLRVQHVQGQLID